MHLAKWGASGYNIARSMGRPGCAETGVKRPAARRWDGIISYII